MFVFRDINLPGVRVPGNETCPTMDLGFAVRSRPTLAPVAVVLRWIAHHIELSSEGSEDFGELPFPARSIDEQVLEALRSIQPLELG